MTNDPWCGIAILKLNDENSHCEKMSSLTLAPTNQLIISPTKYMCWKVDPQTAIYTRITTNRFLMQPCCEQREWVVFIIATGTWHSVVSCFVAYQSYRDISLSLSIVTECDTVCKTIKFEMCKLSRRIQSPYKSLQNQVMDYHLLDHFSIPGTLIKKWMLFGQKHSQ